MKILVPGHLYKIKSLEHPSFQIIRFIRRSSPMVLHDLDWPGMNTQELIRVLIDRTEYLHSIGPCDETANAITWLRLALYEYEARAWRRKQQKLNQTATPDAETDRVNAHRDGYRDVPFSEHEIEHLPVGRDGHILI